MASGLKGMVPVRGTSPIFCCSSWPFLLPAKRTTYNVSRPFCKTNTKGGHLWAIGTECNIYWIKRLWKLKHKIKEVGDGGRDGLKRGESGRLTQWGRERVWLMTSGIWNERVVPGNNSQRGLEKKKFWLKKMGKMSPFYQLFPFISWFYSRIGWNIQYFSATNIDGNFCLLSSIILPNHWWNAWKVYFIT